MSRLSRWQDAYGGPVLEHLRTPLFQNGYALISSAASTSALGFLYWVFAARYYTTEAVGLNATAISTMTFLAGISRLYLDGVLIRFLPRSGRETARLIRFAYLIGGVTAAFVGGIFILGLNFWAPALAFVRTTPQLTVAFVLATVASCIFVQQDGALTGLRQAKWVPVENTLFAAVKLLLLIVLADPLPAYGIFISWTIPLVASLLPVNILIFGKLVPQHVQTNESLEVPLKATQIVHYAGGLYIGYLFLSASARLLPLVVLEVAGSSAAAFFALPWMILSSLQMVIPSMMGSLTVEASRDQTKLVKYSRDAFKQTGRLLVPAVVLLVIAAPYLLRLFGPSYATEATLLLRLLAIATLPQIVIGLYLGIARVQRSVGGVIAVHATSFVIVISLSYFFLLEFGIVGVGVAWLIGQIILGAILFFTQLRPLLWQPEPEPGYKLNNEKDVAHANQVSRSSRKVRWGRKNGW